MLANIYLHYVLDLWFEKRYARHCRGRAYLVRYADDFVACFEDEGDAKRFLPVLQERLTQFSLQVEPTKTSVLRFGAHALWTCRRDGRRRPQTFNFLGFTHYVRRARWSIAWAESAAATVRAQGGSRACTCRRCGCREDGQ